MVDNDAHNCPNGNQSEDRKIKKRIKNQGDTEVVISDMHVYNEQSSDMMKEDVNKTVNVKAFQVRKLSSGLVIHELEIGMEKLLQNGKKIDIYYTGKLNENGIVFKLNVGQTPLKFHISKGEVDEGWDVGLQGIQVRGKRTMGESRAFHICALSILDTLSFCN